jgi:hypothetical protein
VIPIALLAALAVQEPPPIETVGRIVRAHEVLRRVGRTMGDSLWPGFRPDTIPVSYVLPGKGVLLVGWNGTPPAGFVLFENAPPPGASWMRSTALGAASTGTAIGDRPVAQVVVDTQNFIQLVGLTAHETFHVFQASVRQQGKQFGQGENSFLVTSYPVFDEQNEAGMALEGRILAAAERARTRVSRRALARQFLAVRESRHRAIGTKLAEFEQLAELNEGLAEYMLLRAAELVTRGPPPNPSRGEMVALREGWLSRLEHLTATPTLSIRLRYYATGPAQARLLDALVGPKWKERLVAENLTLQDALADAAQYREAERAMRRQAEQAFAMTSIEAAADSGVASLRAFRKAQVDSLLAAPGVLLTVIVEGRSIGLCGIDPQNLLQVDQGVLLHTRWVQVCAGDALQATFNTPVVQDQSTRTLRAVIGADSTFHLNVDGQVSLESPLVSLKAPKAEVSRDGRVLTIRVKS